MSDFDSVWQEAQKGAALKEADLVNRGYTIHAAEWREGNKDGREWGSYMATIVLDGESDEQEAWIGGKGTIAQVSWLIQQNRLPAHVRHSLMDKAYRMTLDGAATTARPSPLLSGKPAFVAFLKEQNMTGVGALALLGVPVDEGEPPEATFSIYLNLVRADNAPCDEPAAYDIILARLKDVLLGLPTEVGPEDDDDEQIPF